MFVYYIQYVWPQRKHATSIYTYEIVILWGLCCKIILASSADGLQAEAAAEQAPPPYQPYGKGKGKGLDLGFLKDLLRQCQPPSLEFEMNFCLCSHCLTSSTQRAEKPFQGIPLKSYLVVCFQIGPFNGSMGLRIWQIWWWRLWLQTSATARPISWWLADFNPPPTDTLEPRCHVGYRPAPPYRQPPPPPSQYRSRALNRNIERWTSSSWKL